MAMARNIQLPRIAEMITKAHASGRNVPSIVLPCKASPTDEVRLYRATDKSRYPGDVQVTDGRREGNTWFGAINHRTGRMYVTRETPAAVINLLQAFNDDPAGVGAKLGLSIGSCVFCSRALTTDASKGAGYGPKCAERYGLPWGKSTAVADVAADYVGPSDPTRVRDCPSSITTPRRLMAERIICTVGPMFVPEGTDVSGYDAAVDAVEKILAGE